MKLRTFGLTLWFVLTVAVGFAGVATMSRDNCYPRDREAANICDNYVSPEDEVRAWIGFGLGLLAIGSGLGWLRVVIGAQPSRV